MASSPKKSLALGTNLLLDLAGEKDGDALLLAFNDADLLPVHAAHPRRLLKALQ